MTPQNKVPTRHQTEGDSNRTARTSKRKTSLAALFKNSSLHANLRTAKVWIVMASLSLGLIFLGHALHSRFGLLIGFLLALTLNSIVFFYADLRLSSLFPGREIEGRDPWGLLRQVREISARFGLRARPQVQIIESRTPIAFSYGLLENRSTIALSSELLEKLAPDEIKVVLAFELHRLKSQATASATAASALVGLITWLARAIDEFVFLRVFLRVLPSWRNRKGWFLNHGGVAIGPMTLIVSPLVAFLVRLSVSRRAVFESDRAAADLVGDPSIVARTLWKLDSYTKTRPFPVNLAEAHLFMVSPLTRYPKWRFASAQPPIEKRLFELTGHEPL